MGGCRFLGDTVNPPHTLWHLGILRQVFLATNWQLCDGKAYQSKLLAGCFKRGFNEEVVACSNAHVTQMQLT